MPTIKHRKKINRKSRARNSRKKTRVMRGGGNSAPINTNILIKFLKEIKYTSIEDNLLDKTKNYTIIAIGENEFYVEFAFGNNDDDRKNFLEKTLMDFATDYNQRKQISNENITKNNLHTEYCTNINTILGFSTSGNKTLHRRGGRTSFKNASNA